jgi:DNA-binding MarR family transcriptional regulator
MMCWSYALAVGSPTCLRELRLRKQCSASGSADVDLASGPEPECRSMSVQNDQPVSHSQAEDAWTDYGSDFVLIAEGKPPPRIELARQRMLTCRLYLGLMQTVTDDYGAEFAAHSDSLAYRTIGIYVFLRTVMCSPVRASQIAHALKLPRISVVRRLEELMKHGYVERVGNAYRVTDKVNIPDLQKKLQRRIDMVAETAKRLAELNAGAQ